MSSQQLMRAPRFVHELITRLVHHKGFHFAASAGYRSLFAFFPLLLCVLSTLALFGEAEEVARGLEAVKSSEAFPSETAEAIQSQLDDLAKGSAGAHVQNALLALVLTLWSASAGMRAVILGLNRALELDDERPMVRRVVVSIVLGAATAVTVVLATVIVAGGPAVSKVLAELPGTKGLVLDVWQLVRWPLLVALWFSWLALVASVAPATRQAFRLFTWGNAVAFVLWLSFTLAFSWYVDNLGRQGHIYGAFAGAAVLMLHAYWSSLIIFIGAEVDGMRRAAAEA